MSSLHVKNLSFAYDKKIILKDIEVTLETGKFSGIIGPNGSGKTTMAKLISRLLKPMDHVIYLDQKDINDLKIIDLAKEMSVVPQATQINYDLTVHEVVMMGRTPHMKRFQKLSKDDEHIVESVMHDTDTWQYKDRLIHQLSGGERQRVIIAKALAQQPKILILDEPVTYLDIHHQLQIMNLIKSLSVKRDITIVMILHDLNYAMKYCDHLILLSDGKVFKHGQPTEVITQENIKEVYKINTHIINHPETGHPMIIY